MAQFRGQFTVANLVPGGFSTITGIGETDEGTFLVDGNAQIAQPINVNRSLATGVAVPSGKAFLPDPGFTLSGGGTGVAGVPTGFLTGAATFDPFQATTDLFGILSVSTTNDNVVEGTPTQVTSPSSLTNQVPPTNPPFAFGSIDINPALVTSVDPAKGNTVTIYNASNSGSSNFNPVGSVVLANPNRLTGLSESFHPEIAGSALINTRGTLNQIYARSIDGAVVNTLGYLAEIRVGRATNSTFLGLPVGHVDIQQRQNVGVYSSPDAAGRQAGRGVHPAQLAPHRAAGPAGHLAAGVGDDVGGVGRGVDRARTHPAGRTARDPTDVRIGQPSPSRERPGWVEGRWAMADGRWAMADGRSLMTDR